MGDKCECKEVGGVREGEGYVEREDREAKV